MTCKIQQNNNNNNRFYTIKLKMSSHYRSIIFTPLAFFYESQFSIQIILLSHKIIEVKKNAENFVHMGGFPCESSTMFNELELYSCQLISHDVIPLTTFSFIHNSSCPHH
jgi:hypothetical protein